LYNCHKSYTLSLFFEAELALLEKTLNYLKDKTLKGICWRNYKQQFI